MQFTELNEVEFQGFRNTYPYQNFWQSKEMCEFKTMQNDAWKYTYVGIKNNDEVIAGCALVYIPVFLKYRLYQCLRGFMIDYENLKLVDFFISELKKYLHDHNCLYFTIDPYYAYQSHDKDGLACSGFKNDQLIDLFKQQGFEHLGFRTTHDHKYEPRWMSILSLENISEDQLLKNMNAHTRQNIQTTIKTGIKLKELKENEFTILKDIISNTGERRNFPSPNLTYYFHFKKAFKNNMRVILAYLDVKDYIQRYQDMIHELESELEILYQQNNSKKNIQRREKKEALLRSAQKRLQEGIDLKMNVGFEIPLAAAMFVVTEYEVVYLFSGSDDTYKHFKAPYLIQWEMIKYALKTHRKRYNFYGISGNFNEDAEDYGVYIFKKGFNADVVELVGDFKYIDRKALYKVYDSLRSIKHKLLK